ncbi:MAG: hypothetical protein N4A35_16870 [Flavobacteriales bacterium]|jgi:hypothetical protein|nr:hypothetical protein [Flavobacteriales bacterium]
MKKHLYFVCPTDYLEAKIEDFYNEESYYYTSLGNSLDLKGENINELIHLIEVKGIDEIIFVLSNENEVVRQIVNKEYYTFFKGFNRLYYKVNKYNSTMAKLWESYDEKDLIAAFLSTRIKEMQAMLQTQMGGKNIKVDGKIFDRVNNQFQAIQPCLFKRKLYDLN